MRQGRSRNSIWLPGLLCLAGIVLAAAPQQSLSAFRKHFRDALRPGQTAVTELTQRLQRSQAPSNASPELRAELDAFHQKLRAAELREQSLLAKSATLQERVKQLETGLRIPKANQSSQPLIVHELIGATVLSQDAATRLRRQAVIAAGQTDDVDSRTYILDGEQPLLDHGESTGVEAGQKVIRGRNVVGRIGDVGVWTSSVRLIIDPEYRGLARLARRTQRGMIWGAEGRLEGNGSPHCVLRSIEATQSVSEGDLLFTAEEDANLAGPMFYGRVSKAELRAGAVEWDIEIKPAADLNRLTKVHVLRQSLNPLRLLAQ